MAHIAAPDQQDNHMDCQTCARRSDWDFLKEFFNREELAKQQIQGLNGHVAQLGAALHHAGQTSQKDRMALNKSHDHMQQLQSGFNQSEAARARLENELHNEGQEHRICQEVLSQERIYHSDTERTLAQLSVSYQRLGDIISKVRCYMDDDAGDSPCMGYNVTDLIHELAEKAQTIRVLELQSEQAADQHQGAIVQLKEKFEADSAQHTEQFMDQAQRIHDLDRALQREQMKSAPRVEAPESSEFKKATQRRRHFRGRGKVIKEEEAAAITSADQDPEFHGEREVPAIREESL
ncbi:hypothetical protein ABVK25_010143 [Lepraria finkii]|uniref:Uncharacterized protein n=1 Tax=Lepraria finkii TaxID=1340010 RepID=A0ABR4AY28_9LECA